MRARLTRRKQSGMSTALMLVFLTGFVVVGTVALSGSMKADQFTNRQKEKSQASSLAEAGINALYQEIREQMRVDETYPFEIPATSLDSTHAGDTRAVGTYEARVVDVQTSQQDTGPDNAKVRITNYTFTLEGVGRTNYGLTTTLRAKFTASLGKNLELRTTVISTGPPIGRIYFPLGAIVANGPVTVKTNNGLRTYAPDGLSGHIIANEGIGWDPATGNKTSNTNPNVLDIQGQYIVHQDYYDWTVSSNGMGNTGGIKNYRSPSTSGMSGWPSLPASSVISATQKVHFADSGEVGGWLTDWRNTVAQPSSTKFMGSTTKSTDVPARAGDGWKIIKTPAYIDGDLEIEPGDVLRLKPTSSNPRENVIYVRGNVRNMGQLLNLGVKIVVEGQYEDTPTAEYKIDTQESPFGTTSRILQNAALISTWPNPYAINFKSNSSVTTGLIYSTQGGIRIDSSNLEIHGILASGGTGMNAGIRINPGGGNSFVVHYTPEAGIPPEIDPAWAEQVDTSFVETTVAWGFSPSKLYNWAMK